MCVNLGTHEDVIQHVADSNYTFDVSLFRWWQNGVKDDATMPTTIVTYSHGQCETSIS